MVTRNGRPAAVLVSPDDLEALEETLALLSDPEACECCRRPTVTLKTVRVSVVSRQCARSTRGDAAPDRGDIVVAPAAPGALSERLPEAVAAAVIAFITGPLLDNPQRLGRELRGELAGLHSARRDMFRILYRIDEKRHQVAVQRIEHRGDVYRPR